MDINLLRSAVTLASLLLFAGLVAWTWWPRQRDAMREAAQLPFLEEGNGWAERRAAPKPAHIPSGDRPAYSTDEGHQS